MRMLFILFPATAIAIAGYIVLYFANLSTGRMKSFGRLLGGWTLLIAALLVLGAATAPMFNGRPFGLGPTSEERMMRFQSMRQKMMGNTMTRPDAMPGAAKPEGAMPAPMPPAAPSAPPASNN